MFLGSMAANLMSAVVAKTSELLAVAPPVFVHLYIEFDMDLFVKELLQVPSGFHPHPFQGSPLMADDDALLGVPFHHDHGPYPDDFLVFKEFLGLHLHRIGDLLFVMEQDLLTNGLVDKKPLGPVCQLVLWIKGRGFRQQFNDAFEDLLYIEVHQGRDGMDFRLGQLLLPILYLIFQNPLFRGVDLVEQQQYGNLAVSELLEKSVVLEGLLPDFHHIEQYVGILKSGFHKIHHGGLQLVGRFDDSRSEEHTSELQSRENL